MVIYDVNKATFSERLNFALDKAGVPAKGRGRQIELKKIIEQQGGKITQNGVRKWLEEDSMPHMDNLVRLAIGLNVSIEWLSTGRGSPSINEVNDQSAVYSADITPSARSIAKKYMAVPKHAQQLIETYLNTTIELSIPKERRGELDDIMQRIQRGEIPPAEDQHRTEK